MSHVPCSIRSCGFCLILALGAWPATAHGGAPVRADASAPSISPERAIAIAIGSRISDMGPDGDETYDASAAAVSYNSIDNQYLVVWEGDDNIDGSVTGEIEIRGQFIDGFTGEAMSIDDFRVSHMGPDGDTLFGGHSPAVAYNSTDNEYLVVWHGNDDLAGLAEQELEIYGQLINAAGAAIGTAFRISAMGGNGDPTYVAEDPQVAYNFLNNEYIVVWKGAGILLPGELEIFGQLISATGFEFGPDDFRISDMGPDGDVNYAGIDPAVAYNPNANGYLVVWSGDDDTGTLVAGEFEIFGQFIVATTANESGSDFRISDSATDGIAAFDANEPALAYNDVDNEFLVVWEGDGTPLLDGEFEIWGRRIDGVTGEPIEAEGFIISQMGDPGDPVIDAQSPAVTHNAQENSYLVVWQSDDDSGDLVPNELEIYGGLITFPAAITQFRLSDMGTLDGEGNFDARRAAVIYNSANNEFLAVWDGDDDTGELVDDELEVYGQRIAANTVEIGTNDFRISTAGGDGDKDYDARAPAAAYNSIDNEYLVVWEGDDDTNPLVEDEQEIFGQRIDAATGAEIGANDFRISDMGPDGDTNFEAGEPSIAYNSVNNLYLVVWEGDDDTGMLVDGEFETWGQLIDGATGAEIGADIRISDVGPDGLNSADSGPPAVAYDSDNNRFLVVWEADDTDAGIPNHKNEIFGQLIDGATGAEVGPNDFRISTMGPNDDPEYDAREAAVAFNPVNDEYLVVWRGEDDAGALVFDEFEIYGQRIDAALGTLVGVSDFRISHMGTDGDINFAGESPAVTHNRTDNEYLVVWSGDDDSNGLVDNELEIYGQLLDGATGAEIGVDDFRISDMGPDGDPNFVAEEPAVIYNTADNEYLVAWEGTDNSPGLAIGEVEIFVQRLTAAGSQMGDNDMRLSHMGLDGTTAPKARNATIAWDSVRNEYLVAFNGDDATGAMVNNENEIFVVTLPGNPCPWDLDGDDDVGITDFLALLIQWDTNPGGPPDFDGDGIVGITDFLALLGNWGPCPES